MFSLLSLGGNAFCDHWTIPFAQESHEEEVVRQLVSQDGYVLVVFRLRFRHCFC